MRIIRAIVAGERNPEVLASFRDIRCHSSVEVIKAALIGNDREEHIFALTQSLDLYDFYQAKIEECDRKLEAAVAALTVKANGETPVLPKARVRRYLHVSLCSGRCGDVLAMSPDFSPSQTDSQSG